MNAHVNFQVESQNPTVAGSTALKVITGRIIRLKAVMKLTGLSRSTIYDRMNPKSPRHDPSFPKQFSLGGTSKRASAVGWMEEEVLAWIAQCHQGEVVSDVESSNPAIH